MADERFNRFKENSGFLTSLIEQIMGPMYGSLSEAFETDRLVSGFLTGNRNLSTLGTFGKSSLANTFLNRQEERRFSRELHRDAGEALTLNTAKLLENYYVNTGTDPKAAKARALDAVNSGMNLGGWGARLLMDQLDPKGLSEELRKVAYTTGVAAAGGATPERERGVSRFFKDLTESFTKDPTKYGGLKGRELGELSSELVKRGGLLDDLDRMGDSDTAKASAAAEKIRGKVQGYAKAIAPLKELFNKSIPELMDRADEIFGTNAASTFSADTIRDKALRFKHTAHMAGIAPETLVQMSSLASSYMEEKGGSGMGADVVANYTALQLSSGVMPARMKADTARGRLLQRNAGFAESEFAREASGAFAIYAQREKSKNPGVSDDALFKSFTDLTKNSGNINELAVAVGASATDVWSRAQGNEAEMLRARHNFGAEAARAGRDRVFASARQAASAYLGERGVKVSADEFRDIKLDDAGAVADLIRRRGGGAQSENLASVVQQQAHLTAQVYGWRHIGEAEAERRQAEEASRKERIRERYIGTDRRLSDISAGPDAAGRLIAGIMAGQDLNTGRFASTILGLTNAADAARLESGKVSAGETAQNIVNDLGVKTDFKGREKLTLDTRSLIEGSGDIKRGVSSFEGLSQSQKDKLSERLELERTSYRLSKALVGKSDQEMTAGFNEAVKSYAREKDGSVNETRERRAARVMEAVQTGVGIDGKALAPEELLKAQNAIKQALAGGASSGKQAEVMREAYNAVSGVTRRADSIQSAETRKSYLEKVEKGEDREAEKLLKDTQQRQLLEKQFGAGKAGEMIRKATDEKSQEVVRSRLMDQMTESQRSEYTEAQKAAGDRLGIKLTPDPSDMIQDIVTLLRQLVERTK